MTQVLVNVRKAISMLVNIPTSCLRKLFVFTVQNLLSYITICVQMLCVLAISMKCYEEKCGINILLCSLTSIGYYNFNSFFEMS